MFVRSHGTLFPLFPSTLFGFVLCTFCEFSSAAPKRTHLPTYSTARLSAFPAFTNQLHRNPKLVPSPHPAKYSVRRYSSSPGSGGTPASSYTSSSTSETTESPTPSPTAAPTEAPTATPTAAPTAAPDQKIRLLQSVRLNFAAEAWTGDLQAVMNVAYGGSISIYDFVQNKYKEGCSVTSSVDSRRAISVTFSAIVSPAHVNAAKTAANNITTGGLVQNVQKANAALGKTVAVTAADILEIKAPVQAEVASSSSDSGMPITTVLIVIGAVVVCGGLTFGYRCLMQTYRAREALPARWDNAPMSSVDKQTELTMQSTEDAKQSVGGVEQKGLLKEDGSNQDRQEEFPPEGTATATAERDLV